MSTSPAGAVWPYYLNLLFIISLGVGLSWWCFHYSDYFPELAGLMGLGGLLSWLALVFKLVPEERKKQMGGWLQRRLESWLFLVFLLLATGTLFWFISSRGTLVISSYRDDLDRVVEVASAGINDSQVNSPILREHLSARQSKKLLLPVPRLSSRRFKVKVSSLPAQWVEVQALRRTFLEIPSSFLSRPVLLVRPSAALSATAQRTPEPFVLVLSHQGKEIARDPQYKGQTVWVGCDEDVALPESILDRWRLELAVAQSPDIVMIRWKNPRAVAPHLILKPGEEVGVQLLRSSDQGEITSSRAQVMALAGSRDFPQEVILDVPHPTVVP